MAADRPFLDICVEIELAQGESQLINRRPLFVNSDADRSRFGELESDRGYTAGLSIGSLGIRIIYHLGPSISTIISIFHLVPTACI